MLEIKLAKPMLAALAACAASVAFNGIVFADDAQTKALQDQMRAMQQQMQEMQKKLDALTKPQPAPPSGAAPVVGPAAAKEAPPEPKFEKFLKGFYGTLDGSVDYTTKGMDGFVAYPYSLVDPANPNSGYVRGPAKGGGAGPVGNVGYQLSLSTNKSVLGYRGSHQITATTVDFIYQLEVQPQITNAPGLSGGYTSQSNVTKGALGYGDSFIGIGGDNWGKLKFGRTPSPYK